MAGPNINLNITGKDSTKGAIKSVETGIKTVKKEAKSGASLKIETSGAVANIKKVQTEVKRIGTEVKSVGNNLTMAKGFNKIVSESKRAADQMKNNFGDIGSLLQQALAGLTLEQMVVQAGAAESKWNRIGANAGLSADEIKRAKEETRGLADKYGIVNGEMSTALEKNIRFYGDLGDAKEKLDGFAATAKRTGKSVEEIQSAFISGELGRSKALQKEILTEEQRNRVMADGKITQDEINEILEENVGFVDEHKELTEDAESAWARMQSSIDSLMVTLGNDLLPVVESMTDVIKTGADLFKKVDDASGGAFGAVTGILLALTAIGVPLTFAAKQFASFARWAAATAVSMTEAATASALIKPPVTTPGGGTVVPAGAGVAGAGALGTGTVLLIGAAGVIALEVIDKLLQSMGDLAASYVAFQPLKDLVQFFTDVPGKIVFGLDQIPGPLGTILYIAGSFNNAIIQIQKAATDLTTVFADVYNTSGLDGVKDLLKSIICLILGCSPGIVPALETLQGVFTTVFDAIKGPVDSAKAGLQGLIDIISKVKLPSIGDIGNFVGGTLTNIGDIGGQIYNSLKDAIPKLKWPTLDEIGTWIMSKIPKLNWKWPTLDEIGTWIMSKIPKLNWKWPSLGGIGKWITDKIPKLNWKWPSWNDIQNYITSKIGWLRWSFPSWNDIKTYITNKIGFLSWSIPSAWEILDGILAKIPSFSWPSGPGGVVGGAVRTAFTAYKKAKEVASPIIQGAKDLGNDPVDTVVKMGKQAWEWLKGGKGPSGPGDNIMESLNYRYENYPGSKGGPTLDGNTLSGNCVDMTLGLMALGGGSMVSGTWNGGPHVWYRDPTGKEWDPARKAVSGTFQPPARGPANVNGNGNIIIEGDIYGFDDFAKQVERATGKNIRRVI